MTDDKQKQDDPLTAYRKARSKKTDLMKTVEERLGWQRDNNEDDDDEE